MFNIRRYSRVYHRARRAYGNVVAPGKCPMTVMFAEGSIITPVSRDQLRYLRWYERLLNR